MAIDRKRLRNVAIAFGALNVFWSSGSAVHAAPDCRANVSAGPYSFSGGSFKVAFKVKDVSGCGTKPASTGKLRYALRIEDGQGHEDVLKNFDAQWMNREGTAFTFSLPSPETFSPDKVKRIKEIIDVSVFQCGCTN